jgi:hypothetical protein
MKAMTFLIIFMGIIIFLTTDCTEETPIELVILSTEPVADITPTTATSGGTLTFIGSAEIFTNGVCWNTTGNPSTADSKTVDGIGNPQFASRLSGLIAGTKYYVRAYATNSVGTAYGDDLTFTTLGSAPISATQDTLGVATAMSELSVIRPTLTTASISDITATSAISGGNITNDGGSAITDRGVFYSTGRIPPVPNKTGKGRVVIPRRTHEGTGAGSFTSSLAGLRPNTTYHVRSYAVNSAGISYGDIITFTTPPCDQVPFAVTTAATDISSTGAALNGTVNANGSFAIVTFEYQKYVQVKGGWILVWKTVTAIQSPVTGATLTHVSADVTGLISGTTHHFKVKAENSCGVVYGESLSFTLD